MSEPFKGLKVVDVLGVFYREDGRLMVADEYEGTRDVDAVLERFVGREVRVLAHHRPHEPHNPARWGGGCCMLESSGECLFGHQDRPDNIYTFGARGWLRADGDRWHLDERDDEGATVESRDLRVIFLEGHRSQIVLTAFPDVERIEETVRSFDPSNIENATLEDLTERLGSLREFMDQINRMKNDIDG